MIEETNKEPPFSEVLYKCPGIHQCPGGTFNWLGVKSKAEMDNALRNGWFRTMPEAIEAYHSIKKPVSVKVPEPVIPEDNAPPTLEELRMKAGELGIKFTESTKYATLLRKIEEALAN